MKDIIVKSENGKAVYLKDVGEVKEGYEEDRIQRAATKMVPTLRDLPYEDSLNAWVHLTRRRRINVEFFRDTVFIGVCVCV